jgi:hypothetical protein
MNKLHERKLTPAEVKDREDIIMKMKDNKRSLVKKYGKDAEAVMYGRATNMAKQKSESMKAKPNRLTELIKDALQNPKKADLNKDGKLSDYEKTRGAAIEKNLKETLDDDVWMKVDALKNNIRREELIDVMVRSMSTDDANLYIDAIIRDYGIDLEDARDVYYDKVGGVYGDKKIDEVEKEKVVKGKDGDKYKKHDISNVKEDLDIGHEDNEPHMLKADLYRIGKYAMEVYNMVDKFDGVGEVDFPSWWQAKIFKAKDALVGAKHYLDFELKEPQIDAVVDVAIDAVDENIISENMNMDKWRRAYNGKSFARKIVFAEDGMGNKKRYAIFFNYKETPRADIVGLSERHFGGHEGGGMPFALSNMQNKPERLFTSDDKMEFGSDEEFDNFVKEGPKGLEDMLSFFLGGKNVDDAIKAWFDTGVQRIVKIGPAEYFEDAKVNENTTKDRISKVLEGLPKGFWDKKIDAKDEDQDGKVDETAFDGFGDYSTPEDKEKLALLDDPIEEVGGYDRKGKKVDNDEEKGIKKRPQAGVANLFKEDYDSLVKKIRKQGKSKKAASAIAGAVASYKAKGGGKGPTAKQK